MAILYTAHARARMRTRGTSDPEVEASLRMGLEDVANRPKLAKTIILPFGRFWGGRRFEQKKLRVIYAEEGDDLIVITVYVYYGSWSQ